MIQLLQLQLYAGFPYLYSSQVNEKKIKFNIDTIEISLDKMVLAIYCNR